MLLESTFYRQGSWKAFHCLKHRKNCESCPGKSSLNLSFLSLISDLSVLSVPCTGYPVCLVCLMCPGCPVCLVCPVCPGCPVCPDDHDDHDYHDDDDIPLICHRSHWNTRVNFLAGLNFYRFNAKNWQFTVYFAVITQKIGNLLCIFS